MAEKNTKKEHQSDKEKALEAALNQITKQYGQGAVMKLGDNSMNMNVDAISTGSISLDLATGIGGVPKGRVTEIYGPESSGKTTLTLHIIAEAQKAGGRAAFIDAEHALDPEYAKNLGVDIDELLVVASRTGEQALEICEMLVRSGALDIVVIDSVAALVPKAEIEGEMGDSHVGLQARLMSQALRKLTSVINANCAVPSSSTSCARRLVMFGNPETTTGGKALKFYASCASTCAHRNHQAGRPYAGQPHPRQGGQEQGGAAVQAGGIRHYVRQGNLP
jgi:recombination protein RecA